MWPFGEDRSRNLPAQDAVEISLELRRVRSELRRLHVAITNQIHTLKQTVLQAPAKRCEFAHERNDVQAIRFPGLNSSSAWKSVRPAEVRKPSAGSFSHQDTPAISDSKLQKSGMLLFPERSCAQSGSTEKDANRATTRSGFGCVSPGFSASPGMTSNSELFNMKESSSQYSTLLCKQNADKSVARIQGSSLPCDAPTATVGATHSPLSFPSVGHISVIPRRHIVASADDCGQHSNVLLDYSPLGCIAQTSKADGVAHGPVHFCGEVGYCSPGPIIARQLEDTVCVELRALTVTVERIGLQLQQTDLTGQSPIGQYHQWLISVTKLYIY
jgi:hypothetical protein